MANFSNNTVTLAGRRLLAHALASGNSLEFTHFGIGDGTAPAAPETLESLVHPLFTIPVAKTYASDTQQGATVARGSFMNSGEKGNFHLRELGLFARLRTTPAAAPSDDAPPILFGYTNAGDSADYIPTVGISSLIEEGIVMTIATGSASVLYVENPTAAASLKDMQDLEQKVKDTLDTFTEEKLGEIQGKVDTLNASIEATADTLSKATEGFVLKAGDTMTGDLNMGEHSIAGSLNGSASQWAGWSHHTSLATLTPSGSSTPLDPDTLTPDTLCDSIPRQSRLTLAITSSPNPAFPAPSGLLEIIKPDSAHSILHYTTPAGLCWHAAHTASATPAFSGWRSAIGAMPGTIAMYAGAEAPAGWLPCHGQSLSAANYPSLFAAIGYLYGGEGDTFLLPDLRGLFPRGLDAGRGLDPGRQLGTTQQSGAPNITGNVLRHTLWGATAADASGAFKSTYVAAAESSGGSWQTQNVVNMDASRCSSVYQSDLQEIRPANLSLNFIIKI